MTRFFAWMRSVHDRYARVILAGIATLLVPLMVMTTVATADNWRQDKERDKTLKCFDQYADAQSSSSVVVREASAKKDVATAAAWTALNAEGEAFLAVTAGILKQEVTPEQFKALNESLARRAKAGRELEKAQADLDQARAENPVPPPPSVFCAD